MSERKARWSGGRAMPQMVSAERAEVRDRSLPACPPSPTQESVQRSPTQSRQGSICTLPIKLAGEILQLDAHLHFRMESDN